MEWNEENFPKSYNQQVIDLELKSGFLMPVFYSFIYATVDHGQKKMKGKKKGQGKTGKIMTQN